MSISITSSAAAIKICVTTEGMKKSKLIIKKNKKKNKKKLNTVEVLVSKTLIDLNISHDVFESIYNVLKEYFGMQKKNKKSKILMINKILKTILLFKV